MNDFRVRCYDAALGGVTYLTIAIMVPIVVVARLKRDRPGLAEL